MIQKDSFTYGVAAADFPISIEVESFDQAANQSEINDALVTLPPAGSVITTFPLALVPVPGKPHVKACKIPNPSAAATPANAKYRPPADVNLQVIVGYSAVTGPDPRYQIRFKPAIGSVQTRDLRSPTTRDFTVLEYR